MSKGSDNTTTYYAEILISGTYSSLYSIVLYFTVSFIYLSQSR